MAGAGLALAAVGFVGACIWSWARVWAPSIAPMAGPGVQLLQSWYLTSVDLHQQICTGGFVNPAPEEQQGQLPEFP